MKTTVLISGQFSEGADRKGNFTGKNATGKSVYIPLQMMKDTFNVSNNVEWKALTPKPNIHAVYQENVTFDKIGADGKPIVIDGVTQTFTQDARATSIFKTTAELATAVNYDRLQDVEIVKQFEETVKASELTQTSIDRILANAPLM